MDIKTKWFSIFLIFCLALILSTSNLFALPVDLNTFTPYPSEPPDVVVIAQDGSEATLYEDRDYAPVSLEKEDFLIPSDALTLSFDYDLIVPALNEDYFDFYIGDTSSPVFWDGGFDGTYSGTYTHDLTALRGQTVSVKIIFDLMYGWDDQGFESYVTVSNVNINTVPIPEPCTGFLFVFLLIGLIGLEKKKF